MRERGGGVERRFEVAVIFVCLMSDVNESSFGSVYGVGVEVWEWVKRDVKFKLWKREFRKFM